MSPKSRGRRSKKHQQSRSRAHLRPVESVPADPLAELFSHFDPGWRDDPLEAEIVASTVLCSLTQGVEEPFTPERAAEALLAELTENGGPEAVALLAGIAALAGPPLASAARAAISLLREDGEAMPPWIDDVGHPVPQGVTLAQEKSGEMTQLICGFRYPGQVEHAVVVVVNNWVGRVQTAWAGADAPEIRSDLLAAAAPDPAVEVVPGDLADARALIEPALARTAQGLDGLTDDDFDSFRALVAARVALLPSGGAAPAAAPWLHAAERGEVGRRSFAMGMTVPTYLDPEEEPDEDMWMALMADEHPEYADRLDEELIDGTNPRLHIALHSALGQQLWQDEPPEVWATAQRLIALGYDRHQVLHALCFALGEIIRVATVGEREYDRKEYAALLAALPQSWEDAFAES